MLNQQIIDYLKQNKDRFGPEALISKLKKAGYPEVDIVETISFVLGNKSELAANRTNFWDFRHKKIYTASGEKLSDFFFGLFGVPIIFWILFYILNLFLSSLIGFGAFGIEILIYLALLIYMVTKRKHIFYGMLSAIAIPIVLAIFLFFIFGGFSRIF